MPKEEKPAAGKAEKVVKKIDEDVVDEKQVLKEAEEREKERKAAEEVEKAEAKKEAKEKAHEEKEKKEEVKTVSQRKKPRHGKKYRELVALIEKDKEYSLVEAIELAMKTSPAKFDATVEINVKVNAKEKNIRGTVVLPGGVAKAKVIVGVNAANVDEVVEKIKKGTIDFDVLVAEAKVMPKLAVVAKILGPKGLMPSPKSGTVVDNIEEAVAELKGGKVEYRADKSNVVHLALGKISFGADRIQQNYEALVSRLPKKIDSIFLATSMGPSVKVAKK